MTPRKPLLRDATWLYRAKKTCKWQSSNPQVPGSNPGGGVEKSLQDAIFSNSRPPLYGDETELFHRHHRRLLALVARGVNARPQIIEDACAYAWLELVARQPERTNVAGWLRIVARAKRSA